MLQNDDGGGAQSGKSPSPRKGSLDTLCRKYEQSNNRFVDKGRRVVRDNKDIRVITPIVGG